MLIYDSSIIFFFFLFLFLALGEEIFLKNLQQQDGAKKSLLEGDCAFLSPTGERNETN
jgi:hypothetical protein